MAAVLCPGSAVASVVTFSYAGDEQTYRVPPGVRGLSITAVGARGGGPVNCCLAAGRGAVVSGVVDVTPGQVVYVEVGGIGGLGAGTPDCPTFRTSREPSGRERRPRSYVKRPTARSAIPTEQVQLRFVRLSPRTSSASEE